MTAKKTTKKKTAKKTSKKKTTTKKAATKKAATTKKKTTSKKKRKSSRGRSLGARSVAEAASAGQADAQGYVYVNGRRVRMISAGGQGVTRKTRTASRAACCHAATPLVTLACRARRTRSPQGLR